MEEMTVIASTNCSGRACPTIYRKDDDTLVIQGYIADQMFQTELPDGEQAVSIPVSLVRDLNI